MDDKIKELVNKVLDRYYSTEKGIALGFDYVDRNKIITMVIGKKQYYDPNKGSFDGFFSTLTKNFLIYLHKAEEVRIKKTIERNRKPVLSGIMLEESKTRYGFDHFKKDGEVKKSYSRKGAYGATLKIMEVFGNRMSHYKCPTCGDYHIGKFTPKIRKKI